MGGRGDHPGVPLRGNGSTVKIDVMLSDSVVGAADRARALEQTGVDGVFSFENGRRAVRVDRSPPRHADTP